MPIEKQTPKQFPVPPRKPEKNNPREEEEANRTWLNFLRLIIVSAIVVVFALVFITWGTYSEEWQNSFVDSIYRVVPYPAVLIGYGNWVTIDEYNSNVVATRRFLETQEAAFGGNKFDFSTKEGLDRLAIVKKNVLNQLIDNKIIEILAKQQGISISNSELNDTTNQIINRDGKASENLTQLDSLYNWKQDDFKERVVKNLLYKQKLQDRIKANGELDKGIKEKVAEVQKKLSSGEDFAQVAKDYSDSPSKQYGGLLPAFTKEEAPQIFADQAFKLNEGETSQPIESDDGWHFIKVERKFQEDGKNKVEIRHISIDRETFNDWLQEKKKQFKVSVLLKPYYWNEQIEKLYFKDDGLNKLEQDMAKTMLNEQNQEADFLLNMNKNTSNNK